MVLYERPRHTDSVIVEAIQEHYTLVAAYLTQRLEYRSHKAAVIGSSPIVGRQHVRSTV